MTGIGKFLSAAAVAAGVLFVGSEAKADHPRPGFQPAPSVYPYPPAPPGWPRPPYPWPPAPPRVDYDYAVYVRVGGFVGWREYGTYETRWQAERAASWLEYRGYQTRIARIPDRPHILGR